MSYIRTVRRHPLQVVRVRYGMGDASTASTFQTAAGGAIGTGTAIGGAIAGSAASAASAAGAAAPTILGLTATAAVPIIGAALAGVTLLITHFIANSGCGQTCVITGQYANQATSLFSQNLHTYMALPSPRSQSQQAAALANFDQIWAWLQQVCGQPGTGNAGVRCIQNQQPGSCPLKTSAYGWNNVNGKWVFTEAGPSDSGSTCWNYFSGFRDPIANDPTVVPDAQAAPVDTSSISALFSGGSSSMLPLLLIGGLVLAGVFLT